MTTADTTRLRELIETASWEELESDWKSSLDDEGACRALAGMCPALLSAVVNRGKKSVDKVHELMRQLLDQLRNTSRYDEALDVLASTIDAGCPLEGARELLRELLLEKYAGEDLGAVIEDHAAFQLGSDMPVDEVLALYRDLRQWKPGTVVYHDKGWDEGKVESFNPQTGEVVVKYVGGHLQRTNFDAARKSLQILDEDDLRTMRLRDPKALFELAQDDPCLILRKVALLHRNKAAAPMIKKHLYDVVVPRSKWAAWWKDARTKAVNDPYLAVEGSASRPTFVLRERPLTLDEEARARVASALTLPEAIQRTRTYMEKGVTDETKSKMFDSLRAVVVRDERMLREEEPSALLEAAMFFSENDLDLHATTHAVYEAVAGDGERLARLFNGLSNGSAKRLAIDFLSKDRPEDWKACLFGTLDHLVGDSAVLAVDRLATEPDQHPDLVAKLQQGLKRVDRSPHTIYALLRARLQNRLGDDRLGLTDGELFNGLLRLIVAVDARRTGIPDAANLIRQITSLLQSTGRGLAADLTRSDLEAAVAICKAPGMREEAGAFVFEVVLERFPNGLKEGKVEAAPFWDSGDIYCTSDGITKRKEEFRVLREVKIPENAEAIGRAASYGDLSENAEWEAAIEEQRLLTEKAEEMAAELKKVKDLGTQEFKADIVQPGCGVRFKDLESGETQEVLILGPWDIGTRPGVISYLAPLAAGILGKRVGEETRVRVPSGRRLVQIEAVENIALTSIGSSASVTPSGDDAE